MLPKIGENLWGRTLCRRVRLAPQPTVVVADSDLRLWFGLKTGWTAMYPKCIAVQMVCVPAQEPGMGRNCWLRSLGRSRRRLS